LRKSLLVAVQHVAGEILGQEVTRQFGSGAAEIGAPVDEAEDVDALLGRRRGNAPLQITQEEFAQRIRRQPEHQPRRTFAREWLNGTGHTGHPPR
jgi:hypothetical protein